MRKRTASGITLTLLLTALFPGVMMPGDVWAHAPGVVLSSWSLAPPNIDGTVSPTEWASANTIPFTTFGGILPGRTGTLHVMNDATNLYIAVAVPDTSPDLSDLCYLYFDNDHDGIFEMGDDSLRIYGVRPVAVPQFEDLHLNPDVPGWTEDWYPAYGIYGTSDGSGDVSNIEGVNYFEFSHPLNSTDDAYDFSLSQGDTVGFALGYYDDGDSVGWFPGMSGDPEDYGDINIALAPRTWTVDDDGLADFHAIQEAISAANTGDTIFVRSGTYYENVVVDKTLSLIGENRENTIIDGNHAGYAVVRVYGNEVKITGFTIRNSGMSVGSPLPGIYAYSASGFNISHNTITNNDCGVWLESSSGSTISDNTISNNDLFGIYFVGNDNLLSGNDIIENGHDGIIAGFSSDNMIVGNNIANNGFGVQLYGWSSNNMIAGNDITTNLQGIYLGRSFNNIIVGNKITDNPYGIDFYGSSDNIIYHNNFVNNWIQASVRDESYNNVWDDGYPSGGNYWSDYTGQDSNGDGIGDSPYVIDENNQDRYPLVNPWRERAVGVKVGDWAKMTVDTSWTGVLPPYLEMWTEMEWGIIEVTDVQGTVITFTGTAHFKDGSEQTTTGAQWDVAPTGSLGFIFWFIGSNLQAGDKVYPSGIMTINETVTRTYCGVPRENNHLNWSTSSTLTPQPYDLNEFNCYWDQATGILTEELFEGSTQDLSSSISLHLKMVDTNLWEAPDPTDTTQQLIETIKTMNVQKGTENSLTSKLEATIHLLDIGNENGAIHKLMEFISQVEALRDKKLNSEQADYLISEAQRIIDIIDG